MASPKGEPMDPELSRIFGYTELSRILGDTRMGKTALWCMAGGAFLLLCFQLIEVRNAIRTNRWPYVPGVVLFSQSSRRFYGARQPHYSISEFYIAYEYSVNGIRHESHHWERWYLWTWLATDLERSHPRGKPVTVYYAPDNPDKSALQPGVTWLQMSELLIYLSMFGWSGFRVIIPLIRRS